MSVVDDIVGVGDAVSAKEAEKIAALSACYDIISRGLVSSFLDSPHATSPI